MKAEGNLPGGLVLSEEVLQRLSGVAQDILNQFISKFSEFRINDRVEYSVTVNADPYKVWETLCFVLSEKMNHVCDAPESDSGLFEEGCEFTFGEGKIIVDKIEVLREIRLKHSSPDGDSYESFTINKIESGVELKACMESGKDYLYEFMEDNMDIPDIVKMFAEKQD